MPDLPEKLSEIISMLSQFEDPVERSQILIGFADKFREVPAEIASRPYPEQNKIPACESDAYVWCIGQNDGSLKFYFAVENPSGVSAKALAVILDRALSGLMPEEIIKIDPDIVHSIFRQNISMGKGIGLMSMVEAVRTLARNTLPK
jgi:cysteine desulfuration protein SufE